MKQSHQHEFSFVVDVRWCLDELLKAQMIDQKSYNLVMTSRRDSSLHPVQVISQFHLTNLQNQQPLTVESLNAWLALQARLAFVKIDPLKVDVPSITKIMSYEYAKSQYILPIEVRDDVVVIGTDQPFFRDWHDNIRQIIRPKNFQTVYLLSLIHI